MQIGFLIAESLFDFAFFEFDVFANNWVVLFHHHFFSDVPRVLFRYIEKARTCCRIQANLDGRRLSHNNIPFVGDETRTRLLKRSAAQVKRQIIPLSHFSMRFRRILLQIGSILRILRLLKRLYHKRNSGSRLPHQYTSRLEPQCPLAASL